MKSIFPFSFSLLMLFAACRQNTGEPYGHPPIAQTGSVPGIRLADTIIYQVIIRNPNPDDIWTARCLRGLNRKALVDSIFNLVYNRKLTAYDRETHEKLTIMQIKEIEKTSGFSRDNIGMIQFTEAWYLDPGTQAMTKEVLAMELGYAAHSDDGEIHAYRSLFRVEMK